MRDENKKYRSIKWKSCHFAYNNELLEIHIHPHWFLDRLIFLGVINIIEKDRFLKMIEGDEEMQALADTLLEEKFNIHENNGL